MDVDAEKISDWCQTRIAGFEGPATLKKFSTGQSNPTYLLSAASGPYVLRAKPRGPLLKSAHMVEREYRAMNALADTPVPVPQMLALAEDDDSPLGRAFFVMEHLEGRIFWDPALPEVSRQERTAIYDAMCETLAALHQLDPEAIGLGDFGKPGNYFARQTARWSKQYLASATDPSDDMLSLIDWLGVHMPGDDGSAALVHGDYRLDNMIFAPESPRIIGLLDWELSTLGHPLADLAYQCMQWRLPSGSLMRGLGGLDRAALGIPTEDAYVARYCAARGIAPPANWSFYLVFSFFRLAAILEGVARRAADGNASNPDRAHQLANVIPQLTALARQEAGC